MSEPTEAEAAAFVAKRGCYCGGYGDYTDYNCGESYRVRCPHCRGTGKKICQCTISSLRCR